MQSMQMLIHVDQHPIVLMIFAASVAFIRRLLPKRIILEWDP